MAWTPDAANSHPSAGAGKPALATAGDRGRLALFRPVPALSAVGRPGPSAAVRRGDRQIVWSVRLPRVVMALLAGARGAVRRHLQGVFQNPLVDPHIIGVTGGSAFGGTLAILLGVGSLLMMASTFFFASSRWG